MGGRNKRLECVGEHHDLLEEHAIMMMDGVEEAKKASMEHETAIIAMWADHSRALTRIQMQIYIS